MLNSTLTICGLIVAIIITSSLIFCVESKVYDKCELARELRDRHSIPYDQIGAFVCIAERQSNLNTQIIGQGSYFGVFQIGSQFWCDSDYYASKACGVSCSSLIDDDLADDVACVRLIFEEHKRIFNNGFQAWPSGLECQSQGNRHIQECLTDQNEVIVERQQQKFSIATSQSRSLGGGGEEGKVYERCELARELLYQHEIPMEHIATWVCIAKHESNFNTSAIGRLNWDGSEDHGLFQISDIYWCGVTGKACGVTCEEMRDNDISNDVRCIQQIYQEHTRLSGDGFTAWAVYPRCKGQSSQYIEGCFDNENEILPIQPVPGVQQPQHKNYATSKPLRMKFDDEVEEGKVYEKCELAQELRYKYKIPVEQVATWVCIARHESNFNTSAIGRLNADGSEDHGLFQISDIYWCGITGKACGLRCEELRDNDISNDIQCMLQIYEEHQSFAGNGFTAWAVYRPHCEGNKADTWIDGCFNNNEISFKPRPAVTQPPKITRTSTKKIRIDSTTEPRFDVKTIAQDFDEPLIYSTEIITTNPTTTTVRPQTTTTRKLTSVRPPQSTTKTTIIPTTKKITTTSATTRSSSTKKLATTSRSTTKSFIKSSQLTSLTTKKLTPTTSKPFNIFDLYFNRVSDKKTTTIASSTRSQSTINKVVENHNKRESSKPTIPTTTTITREITKTTTKKLRDLSSSKTTTTTLRPVTATKAATARTNKILTDGQVKIITTQSKRKVKSSSATAKPFNVFEFYLRDFTSRAPISYRPIQFSDRSTVIINNKKKVEGLSTKNLHQQKQNYVNLNGERSEIKITAGTTPTPQQTTTQKKLSFFDKFEKLNNKNSVNVVHDNRIGRIAPNITPHSFDYLKQLTTPRNSIYG